MPSNTNGKKRHEPQEIRLHVAFKEVYGGFNQLVAGRLQSSRSLAGMVGIAQHERLPSRGNNHTDTASSLNSIKFNDKSGAFEARIQAVANFLSTVNESDKIHLLTMDKDFLSIVQNPEPRMAKAHAMWTEMNALNEINLIDISNDNCLDFYNLEREQLDNDEDLVNKVIANRINSETNRNSEGKGFFRPRPAFY